MSRRPSYFKYVAIIKGFLADVTADVLRMRLLQEADEHFMSLKNFLDCQQVNILVALNGNRIMFNLVYPPFGMSPDLVTWNARLLCLVLKACGCLSARETDDVNLIEKMYRKYILRRPMSCGRDRNIKTEWISLCAAVQRLVEVLDDTNLMQKVRNFMCKVEMEARTLKTRRETQRHLEGLLQELIAENPKSKYRDENMTDEAKQTLKQEFTYRENRYNRNKPRPHSAFARLDNSKEKEKIPFSGYEKTFTTVPRPKSAEVTNLLSLLRDRTEEKNSQRTKWTNLTNEMVNLGNAPTTKTTDIQLPTIRQRTMSVIDKVKGYQPIYSKPWRPESGKDLIDYNLSADKRKHSAPNIRKKQKTLSMQRGELETNADETILNSIDDDTETTKMQSFIEKGSLDPYAKFERKPRSSKIRRRTSGKQVRQKKKHVSHIENLRRPTENNSSNAKVYNEDFNAAGEDNCAEGTATFNEPLTNALNPMQAVNVVAIGERNYVENGRHIHKTTVVYKESLKDEVPVIDEQERREVNSPTNQLSSVGELASGGNDRNPETEKIKAFDDNMKKIANEVLVHQQMHLAAKNPCLHNKKFVDEFFAFLNENGVTKKFLRAQSTEPGQSWRMPDGRIVQFSFLLAFIFRHIEDKEMNMVKYVVEQILLRMQCRHKRNALPSSLEISKEISPSNVTLNTSYVLEERNIDEISTEFANNEDIIRPEVNKLTRERSFPVDERKLSASKLRNTQRRARSDPRDRLTNRSLPSRGELVRSNKDSQRRRSYVISKSRDRPMSFPMQEKRANIRRNSGTKRSRSFSLSNNNADTRDTRSGRDHNRRVNSGVRRTQSYSNSRTPRSRPNSYYGIKNQNHERKSRSRSDKRKSNSKDVKEHQSRFKNRLNDKIRPQSRSRSRSRSRIKDTIETIENPMRVSPSVIDYPCWKCLQKEVAMSICVNWGNTSLCELLNSEGVPFKLEHLTAAVKANNIELVRSITDFLKENNKWDKEDAEVKDAFLFAKRNKMLKIVAFLREQGIHDNTAVSHNSCVPCYIA